MNNFLNFNTKNNLRAWETMSASLATEPMTAPELAKELGIQSSRAGAFIRHYRVLVHISYWKQVHCVWTPVWALGVGEDAEKPMPKVDKAKIEREAFLKRPRSFLPQPVARDWSVEMLFGPALNLNTELRAMHA